MWQQQLKKRITRLSIFCGIIFVYALHHAEVMQQPVLKTKYVYQVLLKSSVPVSNDQYKGCLYAVFNTYHIWLCVMYIVPMYVHGILLQTLRQYRSTDLRK